MPTPANQYEIISAASVDELVSMVNVKINAGSVPIGSMQAFIEGNFPRYIQPILKQSLANPGTLPSGAVAVLDGDFVPVVSGGAGLATALAVVDPDEGLFINVGDNKFIVNDGDQLYIGSVGDGNTYPATVDVGVGSINSVSLAADHAIVPDATTFSGVTGSGTNATITVSNGQITGIALS